MAQLKEGPAARISQSDSTSFEGVRVTHHISKDGHAQFSVSSNRLTINRLSSSPKSSRARAPSFLPSPSQERQAIRERGATSLFDETSQFAYDTPVRDQPVWVSPAGMVSSDASGLKHRGAGSVEDELALHGWSARKAGLHDTAHNHDRVPPTTCAKHEGLYDYNQVALTLALPKLSLAVAADAQRRRREESKARHPFTGVKVQHGRRVALSFDGISVMYNQRELVTSAVVDVGAFTVTDSFFSDADAILVSSNPYGDSAGAFVHVQGRMENHPTRKYFDVHVSPLAVTYNSVTAALLLSLAPAAPKPAPAPRSDWEHVDSGSPREAAVLAAGEPEPEPEVEPKPAPGAAGVPSPPAADGDDAVTRINVQTSPVTLTACNAKMVPMVQVMIDSVHTTHHQNGNAASGSTSLGMQVLYHNMQLAAWEPLLEFADVRAELQQDGQASLTAIFAHEAINFNVTSELLICLTALQVDAEQHLWAAKDGEVDHEVDEATVFVVNQAGVPLSFHLLDSGDDNITGTLKTHSSDDWSVAVAAAVEKISKDAWFTVHPARRMAHGARSRAQNVRAVPKHLTSTEFQRQKAYDPAALGMRGELSSNHVLIQIEEVNTNDPRANTAWRPLAPQSLSTAGIFKHQLQKTKKFVWGRSV
jgi:hypothetical protein